MISNAFVRTRPIPGGTLWLGMAMLALPASAVAADDVAALLAEATQANASLTQMEERLARELESSLTLKRQNEAEFAKLDQESAALTNESTALTSEGASFDSRCPAVVPKEKLLSCNSEVRTLNEKGRTFNAKLKHLKDRYGAVESKEKQRVTILKAAIAQRDALKSRVQALLARIRKQCSAAAGASAEAASAALSQCFDGAGARPALGAVTPSSSATPNRTAQQVADELNKQEAARKKTGLKIGDVPAPK